MKKYIIGLMAILAINSSYAQSVQASLGLAGNPSNVRIYLRPNITTTAVFSSLQFAVALPASITPTPTLTVTSTAFGAAPAASWIVDPPYVENGYIVYAIYTSASGFSLPVTMNTEFQAMEVSFSGGPDGTYANAAHLICLPDGGTAGGNAYFFCTGTLSTSGSSLFYARDATVTATNGFSYNESNPGTPPGNFTSFARLSSAITLPVRFSSFTASRIDNNGQLNWMIENQTPGLSHFDIERSFTGSDFVTIGRKDAVFNGSTGIYNFTDNGVFNSYSGNVYYRIRQTDRNGEITYSPIRLIKADSKGFALNLYPNPVVKEANILFTLSEASQVSLLITDAAGKQYTNINMQAAKGMNQKNIDVSALPAGTYMIHIVANDETQTLSFVKSK